MIVGRENLIKIFPSFKDDVQENGIDLRIGKMYEISPDDEIIGCVTDIKYLPTLELAVSEKSSIGEYYILKPGTYYSCVVDREIEIPDGYCQFYFIRSTFARCGLILTDACTDNGYKGTLRIGIYNSNHKHVIVGVNERIIQAITMENDGTATQYNGSYQNDKIYKEIEKNR